MYYEFYEWWEHFSQNLVFLLLWSKCVLHLLPWMSQIPYTNSSSKAFTLRPQAAPLRISTTSIIENPPLLILRDKDVISSKRPAEYEEREEEEVRHNTSVNPAMLRHGSRVRSLRPDSYGGNSITKKGDRNYQAIHHKEASVWADHEEDCIKFEGQEFSFGTSICFVNALIYGSMVEYKNCD